MTIVRRLLEQMLLIGWTLARTTHVLLFCVVIAGSVAVARDPMSYDDLDSLLDSDPYLPIPPIQRIFPPELVGVWNDALRAPEMDLRRRVAETIASAVSEGMPGLEATAANLLAVAEDETLPVLVRLAAARALVALDWQPAADAVWSVYQATGPDRGAILVPALARWKHERARDDWRAIVGDHRALARHVVMATQGLAIWQDAAARQPLLDRLTDPASPQPIRLAAARALARIDTSNLLSVARQLTEKAKGASFERVLAAELLQYHQGPDTIEFLSTLAVDEEPAVANVALRRLFELDRKRVADLASMLVNSRDSMTRRWAVRAVGEFPSELHVQLLSAVLGDPHPQLRVLARDELLAFATRDDLRDDVIERAFAVLQQDDWRGVEQACRILALLDYKPAAPRLVSVLTMPRFEASVTAAWALRKLAVDESLGPVLSFATTMTDKGMAGVTMEHDILLSHLFQLFAVRDYRLAEPLLRRYLPKNVMPPESRAAAIWTLGHFYAEQPDNPLVGTLIERLADVNSQPPEHDRVRQMCAVSLGRMKAAAALPTLRRFYETEGSNMPAGLACGWAIEQITGEPYRPAQQIFLYRQGWILTPWK